MKDEEMAEEYAKEKLSEEDYKLSEEVIKPIYLNAIKNDYSFAKYGVECYLAGLKAGRPQWHDLEKDPTDLPKDKHNVWCKCLDECGEGWYDKDTDTWTLIYRGYHVHCIEAWCEIPIFDKE